MITGETAIYGILGHPVGHSLSPLIHNAAFLNRRINAAYIPFDLPKPGAFFKKTLVSMENLRGLSVTIPHKVWACRAADRADALSTVSGSANTLVPTADGTLEAFNTDGPGALEALRRNSDIRGKRILLLGYGGSAAAIAHALLLEEKPSQILIAGRNRRKRENFARDLLAGHRRKKSVVSAADTAELGPEDFDVIINTTPLGMKGDAARERELPLAEDLVQGFHTVFDIVYTPMNTPLVELAQRRRANRVPGYLMLLYQATLQFEKFTGEKAPEHLMERELLRALRRR